MMIEEFQERIDRANAKVAEWLDQARKLRDFSLENDPNWAQEHGGDSLVESALQLAALEFVCQQDELLTDPETLRQLVAEHARRQRTAGAD